MDREFHDSRPGCLVGKSRQRADDGMRASAHNRAYLIAMGAALAAYLARYLMQPILGDNHAYSLFYPVILVCAYLYGRGPAILAAALSATLAFWTFVEPRFVIGYDARALTPLLFFAITSGVGIYLITGLTSALNRLAVEQGEARAVADAHAGLFRNLQARIGHHMHLIVGVLMIQARGEADPEILALLRRAGSRSQLISQIHRDFSGEPVSTLEFCEFSRSLARIVCAEAKAPEDRIEVLGDAVRLPVEVATSLGVALVECLTWIAARHPSSRLRIRLRREDERVMVMVSQFGDPGPEIVAMTQGAFMFRAMVEQAGAEVIFAANSLDGPAIEITLPVPAPTVALADAGMTLH